MLRTYSSWADTTHIRGQREDAPKYGVMPEPLDHTDERAEPSRGAYRQRDHARCTQSAERRIPLWGLHLITRCFPLIAECFPGGGGEARSQVRACETPRTVQASRSQQRGATRSAHQGEQGARPYWWARRHLSRRSSL